MGCHILLGRRGGINEDGFSRIKSKPGQKDLPPSSDLGWYIQFFSPEVTVITTFLSTIFLVRFQVYLEICQYRLLCI